MLPLLTAADANPTSPQAAAPAAGRSSTKALGKVELDLDGAPFLEPDEPEPAPKREESAKDKSTPDKKKPAPNKKKKIIIIAGLLLFILGGGATAYKLFFSEKTPAMEPNVEVVVVPSKPVIVQAPVSTHIINWPAFWVELRDSEGEIRFLVCQLTIPTDSDSTVLELRSKTAIVRDAVFYYLSNKSYVFLADMANLDTIKKDMTNVINEYLMSEKLKEVLLENYLIK